MRTPLEGIRVLDWTAWQQGPVATALLADMGAEVIKIEPPEGEPGRGMLRMYGAELPLNFYYQNQNRGKKGVVLNLAVEKAREVLYQLVEKSDVFVTNYRESAARKLKVDYDTLRKYNPRLIYALSSSFGPKGPDADRMSADVAGQARGGMWSITQSEDLVPTVIGAGFADEVGGLVTAYGVMTALLARERYGIGQRVDASLLGGQIEIGRLQFQMYLMMGILPPGSMLKTMRNPLYYAYQDSEGKWFAIAALQADRFWPQFCKCFGMEHLEKDPRFENQLQRAQNFEELKPILKEITTSQPRSVWLKKLEDEGLPVAPVNDYSDLANDPQVWANGYILEIDDPIHGKVRVPGIPVQLSETPGKVTRLANELGQHTEEVLMEVCGYTWDDLAKLREEGVY
ncbi:MAG: CoA transferase [Dehalococcoidia bacterium]|nr:CoA transferase [Dehalococcoidia bacterium]